MTGKTHLAVGCASALCILQPNGLKEWVLCIGAAAIGSVISDVDVSTSDSHEKLNKITALSLLALLGICFAEYRWHLGILKNFRRESSYFRLISGFAAFLAVCSYGKNQPHRSFMHSLTGLVILSGIVYAMYPQMAPYFATAMLSHIAIDLLNRKRLRLLYPLRWGLCFDVCRSNGLVNRILASVGSFVSVAASALLLIPGR